MLKNKIVNKLKESSHIVTEVEVCNTGLADHTATETWENVTQSNDTDGAYDNFLITFTRALDVACPFKTKKLHHSKRNTYHNAEALSLQKEFIKAKDKFNLTGRIEDKTEANRKKKAYDLKLRELRKEANADYINQANNKTKAIWEIINRERAAKNQTTPGLTHLKIDKVQETDPNKIANHLNTFFINTADNTL
ncbi:hypothetical protein J6590_015351 [Homalodisca vitripennis]|nr:hypothetical protein J6590_015351 [Homalodisca vitripennis]